MPDPDQEFRTSLEAALKTARNEEGAKNLLALLFPKAERVLQTYSPTESLGVADRIRMRRISQKDFAERYFRLDPGAVLWRQSEIESVLDSEMPTIALEKLTAQVEAADASDRPRLRRSVLEFMNGAFDEARPFTVDWLRAVVKVAPYFLSSQDEHPSSFFWIDNRIRLGWILTSALKEANEAQRFELFSAVIPEAEDISLLCGFVRTMIGDLHPDGAAGKRERQYFGVRTSAIREQLLARVRLLADRGLILSQADPGSILWFWWGSNFEQEVKTYTDAALHESHELLALLQLPISTVRSSSGNYEHVQKSWSKIIDLDALAARARQLLESPPSEFVRAAAIRFLKALAKEDRE